MTFLHNQGRIYHTVNRLRGHTLVIFLILFAVLLAVLSSCKENPVVDDDDDYGGISIMPVTPAIDDSPSWSPDGSTIAFYHHGYVYDTDLEMEVHDPDSVGLWFISPDGSNKRIFLKGGDLPAWGPKGEWLAIRYGQIHKIKANGDSLTQLTFEGRNFFPAWSPDGKWIAYDNTNCGTTSEPAPPNSCGILIMENNGSGKQLLLIRGRFPAWSPDGNHLIFIGLGSEIYRINVKDTTKNLQLTMFRQTYEYVDLRSPSYSPGGLNIVFSSSIQESYGVWVMDSSGHDLNRLTQDGRTPSWSPDGRNIVYVGPEKTLWIMDADGRNKKQLTFRPKPY